MQVQNKVNSLMSILFTYPHSGLNLVISIK